MTTKQLFFTVLFCCANVTGKAISTDSVVLKRSFYAFPFASYQQETHLASGVTAAYYFKSKDLSRISSIAGTTVYTLLNQFSVNLSPKIYLGNNKYFLYSNFTARNYPDRYYGIGNQQNASPTPFTARGFSMLLQPQYLLSKSFFVGTLLSFESEQLHSALESRDPLLLYRATDWQAYHQLHVGVVAAFDSRDNQFYPKSGNFAKTTLSLSNVGWGSSYTLQEITLDLRNYLPLAPHQLLATQLYFDGIYGRVPPPFGQLPSVGGTDLLRGFRQGQYRENVMVVLQSEYRFQIYKKLKAAAFCATGDAMNSTDYKIDKLKVAYGAGLRYQLNDARVHLRFDVAKNYYGDKLKFYLTATEAF